MISNTYGQTAMQKTQIHELKTSQGRPYVRCNRMSNTVSGKADEIATLVRAVKLFWISHRKLQSGGFICPWYQSALRNEKLLFFLANINEGSLTVMISWFKKKGNRGNRFQECVITADEKLVRLYVSETKRESSAWETLNCSSTAKSLVRALTWRNDPRSCNSFWKSGDSQPLFKSTSVATLFRL